MKYYPKRKEQVKEQAIKRQHETQEENKRLKTLLYNALVWIDEDNGNLYDDDTDKYEWFESTIGITKEEMDKVGFEI